MNRGAMATATRDYLGQLGTGFVTGTILTNALNRSLRKVNAETGANRGSQTINYDSGYREHSLIGTIIEVYRVRIGTGTERKRLDPTNIHALDAVDGDWEAGTAGTPAEYYTNGMYIGFDPKPHTATVWTATTRFATSAYVAPVTRNGYYYTVATAGTTGAAEPTWPTTSGSTVANGSGNLKFKRAGLSRAYLWCLNEPASLATATTTPTWLPSRFHDTIAKGAAVDLARGLAANSEGNLNRFQILYGEYLAEVRELRALADGRARETTPRLAPSGYGTFRRD